ncbi:MAG: phosphate-starvation-inducible PsiE family protein [Acidimicrobiia bacterium]|nr:phosphate-starvation-inducible PsiE family protein [Acidimicrobiia bacterium]
MAVLGSSGYSLVDGLTGEEGTKRAIELTLDSLLLAFILVELLGAVRSTLTEKGLVAEPFLLVGIIASIKEIVVLGAFERGDRPVEDVAIEAGALAGVVLLLSISAFLVRRKEREPDEGSPEEDSGGVRPATTG